MTGAAAEPAAGSAEPIPPALRAALARQVEGELIYPGDEPYERARRVWNGSIDRHPAVVIRCRCLGDVAAGVDLARTALLPLAVRGGGHNVAGFGTCDGGVVIDLSGMSRVEVNPGRRTARAGGGATWGQLDPATHALGLATTGGQVSTTGVGGLTLGGGVGWLMRKHGLSCDNLLSAEVVLADGQLLTASAGENDDLFWGLRGGGGNFGVVTSLELDLHPLTSVLAGAVTHPPSNAAGLLRVFRDFTAGAPDEVTTQFGAWAPVGEEVPAELAAHGLVAGIAACWAGPIDVGEEVLRPLRQLAGALADDFEVQPYPQLQRRLDAGAPAGMQSYAKAEHLNELTDEVIDIIADAVLRVPSPASQLYIVHMGGAVARVGPDETAFAHRQAPYLVNILSIWPDPAEWDEHVEWARATWASLRPFSAGGAYVNFLGNEGHQRIRDAYGPATYDRLAKLKVRYDPTNLFSLNQNIPPAR